MRTVSIRSPLRSPAPRPIRPPGPPRYRARHVAPRRAHAAAAPPLVAQPPRLFSFASERQDGRHPPLVSALLRERPVLYTGPHTTPLAWWTPFL